jgi:NAD(P)-dependent dehydrogenase (short-subunit alcohol dehydrogenase family)
MLTDELKKLGLSDSSLKDKVAVISGAGRGIGKELAIALSRLGASVVIAELNDNGADVESLIRSGGGSALFVKADVSDEDSVKALAEKALNAFGKVDILVNNPIAVTTGSVLESNLVKLSLENGAGGFMFSVDEMTLSIIKNRIIPMPVKDNSSGLV